MTTGSLDARSQDDGPGEAVFVPVPPDHPDAAALLDAFFREQVGRYGYAEPVDLDPDVYTEPNGVFVVIYQGNQPVGCGGCRRFTSDAETFEIKKTYLTPEARGRGLGRKLLNLLERTAAERGGRRIILETGVRNVAARGLFASNGYSPIARYVDGRDPAINRAFEKVLPSSSRPLTADVVPQANSR